MPNWLFDESITVELATEGLLSWIMTGNSKPKPKVSSPETGSGPPTWENSPLKQACVEADKLFASDAKKLADAIADMIDSRFKRNGDPCQLRTDSKAKKELENEVNDFIDKVKAETSRSNLIPTAKYYNSKGRWLARLSNSNRADWVYPTVDKRGATDVKMAEEGVIFKFLVFYIRDLIEDGKWNIATESFTWTFM